MDMINPFLVLAASLVTAADTADDTMAGIDFNTLLQGGSSGAIVGAVLIIIKLVVDRTLPGRSDQRANVQITLDSLNNVIKVLQEEKTADAKRLEDKQARIDVLEVEAEKDYDRISELRGEIIDLRQRLAVKDRHITALVSQLRRLGVVVAGIELDDTNLEITFTQEEIQATRAQNASPQSPETTETY